MNLVSSLTAQFRGKKQNKNQNSELGVPGDILTFLWSFFLELEFGAFLTVLWNLEESGSQQGITKKITYHNLTSLLRDSLDYR